MATTIDDLNPTVSTGGIKYVERQDSMDLQMQYNGVTGRRVFFCDWVGRIAFCREFLARSTAAVGGFGTIYTPPKEFPGYPGVWAVDAVSKGVGPIIRLPDGTAGYGVAEVTISYDSSFKRGTIANQTVRSYSVELTGEFFQPPKRTYKWTSDNVPLEENVGIVLPQLEIQVEELGIVVGGSPDYSKWIPFLGSCNNNTFAGIPAEQCVYFGFSAKNSILIQGPETMDLTHKFRVKTRSWNMFMRGNGNWEYITPKPYTPMNFNLVFAGT